MEEYVFDVWELWRRIDGVKDPEILAQALEKIETATEGRRVSEEEQAVLLYLRGRI